MAPCQENFDYDHTPAIRDITFVNFFDKAQRRKGLSPAEKSEFRSICALGVHRVQECYALYDCYFSPLDVKYACRRCEHCVQETSGLPQSAQSELDIFDPWCIHRFVPGPDTSAVRTDADYSLLMQSCTWVYFISDGEAVKIGVAKEPLKRLSDLQVSNPRELHLLFAIPFSNRDDALKAEGAFHHRVFRQFKVRGEWYNLVSKLNVDAWRRAYPLHDVPGYDENYGE